MKQLTAIIGLLVVTANAYACPNLTGEWVCKDSKGEQWTESITTTGNKYVVVLDKGTPSEKTEEYVVDGKPRKEGSANSNGLSAFFEATLEKSVNLLPKDKQAAFVLGAKALTNKVSEIFQAETTVACKDNAIVSEATFFVIFSIPLVFSATAKGSGNSRDVLEGNQRKGTMNIQGSVTGKPASLPLYSDIPEKTENLDEVITMECVKK